MFNLNYFHLFSAVEFIHGNFSEFLKIPGTSSRQDFFESASSQNRDFEGTSTSDELSQLLLNLLKVNGSPLLDITLDISPRNSSKYLGVIRVPGKAAILPRLARSRKDFAIFSRRWVRNVSNYYEILYLLIKHMYSYVQIDACYGVCYVLIFPVNLHPLFLFSKHGSVCDPEKNQVQNVDLKKARSKKTGSLLF